MPKPKQRFDPTVLAGLALAVACILGGLTLEKGDIHDVTQVTSALIVIGGTLGAVIVSTPLAALGSAVRRLPTIFWIPRDDAATVMEQLVSLAVTARRTGTTSLENKTDDIADPFLKKGIGMVADSYATEEIRNILEMDLLLSEQQASEDAKVFDSAGGYAPTIGIIGAVLGLMQVMKHLDNIQDVGRGIAIAFVATVYGVGAANLLFLPIAAKMRAQCRAESRRREMIIEATICIQEGKNPRVLRQLLEPFVSGVKSKKRATEEPVRVVGAEPRDASAGA